MMLIKTVFFVIFIVLPFIFYLGVISPLRQQFVFGKLLKISSGNELIPLMNPLIHPYTPAQSQMRIVASPILREWEIYKAPEGRAILSQINNALEEVIEKNPGDMRAYDELILNYIELGAYDQSAFAKAELFARKAVAESPGMIKMNLLLAEALFLQKKFDEAGKILDGKLVFDPRSAIINLYNSMLHSIKGSDDAYLLLTNTYTLALAKQCSDSLEIASIKNSQFNFFNRHDFENMIRLFIKFGDNKRAQEIAEYEEIVTGKASGLIPGSGADTTSRQMPLNGQII